jgi:hypothetical protein
MFFDIKKNKGFTMLEAVIATSIVIIGIMGILIVSQNTVLIIYFTRDRFTAAYLAKEGMEIVRNIRDENLIQSPPRLWNHGLLCPTPPCNFMAQFNDATLRSYVTGTSLRINPDGFYNYDIGTLTKFTRRITITNIGPDSIRVNVRVNWDAHTFLLEENLYNWR